MALPFSTRISPIYALTEGQVGPFTQSWPLYAAADLAVYRRRGGITTLLVLDADYSVTGAGSDSAGFSVLLLTGAMAGDQIVLIGSRNVARITTYTAERGTTPTFLNLDLNMVFAQLQEMLREIERSFKTDVFTPTEFNFDDRRLTGVGDAVNPSDAVNLGQINTTFNNATASATATAVAAAATATAARDDVDATITAATDAAVTEAVALANAAIVAAIADAIANTGAILGTAGSVDNRLPRADGAGGKTLQASEVEIDDAGAFIVPEIATPATPSGSRVALYTKSDHKLYKKDSTGTEEQVGAALPSVPSFNGIQFPATQVPSSDPNCLDDYEETTWTPVLTDEAGSVSGVTYSSRTGLAIKIGKLVWYQCDVQLSNKGTGYTASSALRINGLPFANGAGVFIAHPCECDNVTFASGRTMSCLEPLAGATYFHLATSGTAAAHANVEGANLTNSSAVHGSGSYSTTS